MEERCPGSAASSNGANGTSQFLRIKFVVIGAGVAGLACAIALRQAGHDVHVIEAMPQSELGQSPSGVRVPPNMAKILARWDLDAEFRKSIAGRSPAISFLSAFTGEIIGELNFHPELMKAIEAEFSFVHHGDLVMGLYKYAIRLGAQFSFGARVTNVDSSKPSVTLDDGREVFGDLIIGADGEKSIIRRIILDEDEDDEQLGPYTYAITSVPVSVIADCDELMEITDGPYYYVWMGDDWEVLAYPVRQKEELAVGFYVKDGEKLNCPGDWRSITMKDINIDTRVMEPRLQRLIRHIKKLKRTRDHKHVPLDDWFDESGKLFVTGQAAHATSLAGNHPIALCLEDAVILGGLFSRLKSESQIPQLLSAFQELREERRFTIGQSDDDKLIVCAAGPGPLQQARDETMRKAREVGLSSFEDADENDEYLRNSFEELRIYAYDAFEEVETWWVEWGVVLDRVLDTEERHNHRTSIGSQIGIERRENVLPYAICPAIINFA